MKKILILLLALMPVIATAQQYKPLEPVEVPETYSTKIRVSQNELLSGEKYYSASHFLGQRGMTADFDVPADCDLTLVIEAEIKVGMTAVLSVGGRKYYPSVSYVAETSFEGFNVYINLHQEHLKHIAVSGLQSITFRNNGDLVHEEQFNAIEQELWRRTADELGRAAFIIY